MLRSVANSFLNYGKIDKVIHITICDESGNVANSAIKRLFDSDSDDSYQNSGKKKK